MKNNLKYMLTMFMGKRAKRPVIMLPSQASVEIIDIQTRSGPVTKPLVVHKYNNIDVCDRAVGDCGTLQRQTRKW